MLGVFAIFFFFLRIGNKHTMWSILVEKAITILIYIPDFDKTIQLEFL